MRDQIMAVEEKLGAEKGRVRIMVRGSEIFSDKQGFGDGIRRVSSRCIMVNSSSIHGVVENSIEVEANQISKKNKITSIQ